MSSSTLLWLFQVVNSVFIVSVRSRLLSVVVGCSLFRLFQALASYFRLSRLFELFKIVSPRLACLKCFGLDQVDRKFNVLHQSWRDSSLLGPPVFKLFMLFNLFWILDGCLDWFR